MTNPPKRGEIWLADLNPTQGSEQAGIRPVIIFQNDLVSQFSTTIIAIPLTTNQRRAALPICLPIKEGNGGLSQNSVALCFQMRVLDKTRLIRSLGQLSPEIITQDDLRPEYDFTTSESVNEALRLLMKIMQIAQRQNTVLELTSQK